MLNPISMAKDAPSRFPFYMLKEIYEQPEAVRQTLVRHLDGDGRIILDRNPISGDEVRRIRRVIIAARFKASRPDQPTPEEISILRLAWENLAA